MAIDRQFQSPPTGRIYCPDNRELDRAIGAGGSAQRLQGFEPKLEPNTAKWPCCNVAALADRLNGSRLANNQTPQPFDRRFTRDDLTAMMQRLDR